MMIVYHGGGYVGMTGAVHFALVGKRVLIYDPDQKTVDGINAGQPRTSEYLQYLNSDVEKLVASGSLRATADWSKTLDANVHIIAVPTERDGEPYDEIVKTAIRRLCDAVPDRTVILVESTLTPGTIDGLMEKLEACEIGKNLFLAVCPRRDWFADPEKNLATLPRIVGGVTPACTEKAIEVLSAVSKHILPTTYRTAEITKALENALLHVPVMFAYQLAHALPEHDVAEALRLTGTHWRFTSLAPLYLGFGTGGRCVSLGAKYLAMAAGGRLPMAEQAIDWDDQFRTVIADRVARVVGPNGSVLVLGIAYRPEFRDAGLSPGLAVAQRLKAKGIEVAVHDPMWHPAELTTMTSMDVASDAEVSLLPFDAVLLATPHKMYLDWPADPQRWRKGQYVLDGQGAWDIPEYRALFEKYGVRYVRVGKPGWLRVLEEATV